MQHKYSKLKYLNGYIFSDCYLILTEEKKGKMRQRKKKQLNDKIN